MKQFLSPNLSLVRRVWPAYCILGVIFLLTLVAARNVALVGQARDRAALDSAVDQTREQFQRIMNGNLVLLDGLRGLANAKVSMGKAQFQAYVEALPLRENYPGAQGVGFAWRLVQERKVAELEKIKERTSPSFHVWPDSQQPEWCPVIFLAPPDDLNDAEIGFDLYSDPVRRSALERAAETGRPSASGKFALALPADGREQAGFLLITPMYWSPKVPPTSEQRLRLLMGFIYCSFRLDDLFKGLSKSRPNPEIAFRVYEGAELDPGHLVYDSAPESARPPGSPPPTLKRTLAIADRTWTVVFSPPPGLAKDSALPLDPFVAAGGTLIGFLLFGMMLAQARARVAVEKHAEVQREAESRFRSLVEQSIVGIYVIQDGRFVYSNPRMAEIYGCTPEELAAKPQLDFVAEESRALTKENIEKRLRGDVQSIHFEIRALRQDGKVIDVEAHGGRTEYNGRPAILGCLIEITERKLAEQKMRAQLSRLDLLSRTTRAIAERQDLCSIFQVVIRSLEDHLPIDFCCVCLYDDADDALTVTSVGQRSQAVATEMAMTEQARIDIDQNGLSRCVRGQVVHEPDISEVSFPFPQRLARGGLRSLVAAPLLVESKVFGVLIAARRQAHSFSSGECEFLRQLSEHVAMASHQAQLNAALRQAYDDLHQTQQAAMQQDRLRALGQMASGIAHDINNAISPVMLYTETLLEREPNLSTRARECLQTIQQSIHDVAETVARMREFSRPREPQLKLVPVQLNRLVPQVVDLTRARWSDLPQQRGIVIRVITDLADGLPVVLGIESEIREALTNLIFNAVDAMPAGGTLTFRTGLAEIAPDAGNVSPHAHIEVTDTGAGMDEDTRRRCLEPFFTTKGERGTGLGLAMVYGTVQRHGGEIQIESVIGQGTTVRLSLPVPATAAAEPVQPTGARAGERPPRMRILVIDDDPVVLLSLRHTLEFDGHTVVTANDGQTGIDAFHQALDSGELFMVVITDLGMPHVDGRRVAAEVKRVSPSTPVILHTGWGQRLVAEGDIPPHVDRVLSKPVKLRELREVLIKYCPV